MVGNLLNIEKKRKDLLRIEEKNMGGEGFDISERPITQKG